MVATYNGRTEVVSVGSKCIYSYDPKTGKELWRLEFANLDGNQSHHTVGNSPIIGPDMIYFCTGHGRPELWALRPGGTGVLGTDAVVWKMTKKGVPKRSSPVLVDGLLYMVDDEANATCIDAKTGQEVWRQRLEGKTFSASPIYADGRIYFFSEGGVVTTIAPGREFKKLGEGSFEDGFMGTPAISDGAFFLRTRTALYRVQK
jgi:outer membrane protein assembly factor BamB